MTLTAFQLTELEFHFNGVPKNLRDRSPFYWTSYHPEISAPSGWYQWTASGLIYLGASILEEA
jgi:hypothetical protein